MIKVILSEEMTSVSTFQWHQLSFSSSEGVTISYSNLTHLIFTTKCHLWSFQSWCIVAICNYTIYIKHPTPNSLKLEVRKWLLMACPSVSDILAHTHTEYHQFGLYTSSPHTALGYSYSNRTCGNPWTLSHVCGRLGIPTTFLFWLTPERKKEAVQSQFPHFVV